MGTSLERLYMEHFRALRRFAIGLTGSIDEASDIVQTVFMRLASKASLPEAITKAYLFSAVRNGAKDLWKRKRAVPFSQLIEETDEGEKREMEIGDTAPGPMAQAEKGLLIEVLLEAFQELTNEQREVLSLKYFSGCSTREVAETMGKTENTVRQMEFRALRSLRRVLQRKEYTV